MRNPLIATVRWYKVKSSGERYEVHPEDLRGIDWSMTSLTFVDRKKCKPRRVARKAKG